MPTTRPWNYASHVTACPECNGAGKVASHRQATVNDPYPEAPCPYGCAEHLPECAVCGFGVGVAGYDCLACATVEDIPNPAKFDVSAFAAAMARAIAARLAADVRIAA